MFSYENDVLCFCLLELSCSVHFIGSPYVILALVIRHGKPSPGFDFLHHLQPFWMFRGEWSLRILSLHLLHNLGSYSLGPFLVMKQAASSHLSAGVKTVPFPDGLGDL